MLLRELLWFLCPVPMDEALFDYRDSLCNGNIERLLGVHSRVLACLSQPADDSLERLMPSKDGCIGLESLGEQTVVSQSSTL